MPEVLPAYAGADWVKSAIKPEISSFGIAVADLLGDLFLGIYHLPISALRKVEWSNDRFISINLHGSFATFDGDTLTRMVVLCHDRCIRGDVSGKGPRLTELAFSRRAGRQGSMYERHPTLEDAAARIRAAYHPVLEPQP